MGRMGGRLRGAVTASGLAVAAALGGCGFDGVELNGAVFDYLGVSGSSNDKGKEPKVAARPGIVLPPQTDRLPEPGSGETAGAEAWPMDPDERKLAAAADLDRRHEEYCRDALWQARVKGQHDHQIVGPKGQCNPSILRSLTGRDITTR